MTDTTSVTCSYVAEKSNPENWGGEKPEDWQLKADTWSCPHAVHSDLITDGADQYCIFHTPPEKVPDEICEGKAFTQAINSECDSPKNSKRKKEFIGASFGQFKIEEGTVLDSGGDHPIRILHSVFNLGVSVNDVTMTHGVCIEDSVFSGNTDVSFSNTMFCGDGDISFNRTKFSNEGKVDFQRVSFENSGSVRFKGSDFNNNGEVTFYKTSFLGGGNVCFEDASFCNNGRVLFWSAKLLGKGDIIFTSAEFTGNGDVKFNGCEFNSDDIVSFQDVTFRSQGEVSFAETSFNGSIAATFQDAKFHKEDKVSFNGAEFNGSVQFREATFAGDGEVTFNHVKFKNAEYISFTDAEFGNDDVVEFINADFSGNVFLFVNNWGSTSDVWFTKADFTNCNLNTDSMAGMHLEEVDFTGLNLSKVDFDNSNLEFSVFFRTLLHGTTFHGAKIDGASFGNAQVNESTSFMRNQNETEKSNWIFYDPRYHEVEDDRWSQLQRVAIRYLPCRPSWPQDPRRSPSIGDTDKDDWKVEYLQKAARTYQTLEKVGRENSLPNLQTTGFVGRQEMHRYRYAEKASTAEKGSLKYWGKWLRASVARISLLYGESPWRVIGVALSVIFTASLIYPLGGFRESSGGRIYQAESFSEYISMLPDSLYFSTLTFTTLGFGDFQPHGWGRWLATTETALGATLVALLVFVLGRRAAR